MIHKFFLRNYAIYPSPKGNHTILLGYCAGVQKMLAFFYILSYTKSSIRNRK
ncbi:hypothetical protein HMPREF0373_01856 [Eubacterium ramulus ATCC 29099]|uniref:Uncharacterized protein n=1 Tax=Eubacterium ramulus ATCC 29099 TaxID=1256908 RepID=U2R685_EUBRA|nr:hypothetical protein HMPREF0373_01856 [Eubacterium ramulus ATCC 29099]